jgi:hypothetical protein
MVDLILTTFDWVPETPRGYVRDIRVRWALEEAGLPYCVKSVPFHVRGAEHFSHQPFGQVPWLTDKIPYVFEAPNPPQQLGKLWGDRAIGPAGTLLKVPAGFRAPIHAHTADYRGIVIEGTWSHWIPDTAEGKGIELAPGSYWTQEADQFHADACISTTDCVILLINETPYRTYLPK